MSSFVKIGPVGLEKKMQMWKVYSQNDVRTMITKRSEKLVGVFSTGRLKIKAVSVQVVGLY